MSSCHVIENWLIIIYQKVLLLLKTIQIALINVPLRVKQIINAEHIYKNDFVIACYRSIPSAANILKIITICSGLYRKLAPKYYNDKRDAIRYI